MEAGQVLVIVGLIVSVVAFLFFRLPGVPFFFMGPIWRARRYLTPAGVTLWASGAVLSLVGTALHLSS